MSNSRQATQFDTQWEHSGSADLFFAPRLKIEADKCTAETYVASKVLPPERERVLQSLAHLKSLEDNFDGVGTLVPEDEVLETAERFIQRCFGHMYPTHVYPGMDRTLVFMYQGGNAENLIHITVEVDAVHVAVREAERFRKLGSFGIPLSGVSLPKDLKALLPPYRS